MYREIFKFSDSLLGGEFGVLDLLEPLVADLGEPALEGLGLGGRDGLDDPEKSLGVGGFDFP